VLLGSYATAVPLKYLAGFENFETITFKVIGGARVVVVVVVVELVDVVEADVVDVVGGVGGRLEKGSDSGMLNIILLTLLGLIFIGNRVTAPLDSLPLLSILCGSVNEIMYLSFGSGGFHGLVT
jgi:hypothetical protein